MERRLSPFKRVELLCACATLAAQATAARPGFRQRDLKFYVELFVNWLQYSISEEPIRVANMQIARYLREICELGYCRESRSGSSAPRYMLNRVGLVELARSVVDQPVYKRPAFLFFVEYFIGSYHQTLREMIKREGTAFPPALKLEVESILNLQRFRTEQRRSIELEIRKLELRIRDSQAMASLAERLERQLDNFASIAEEVEKKYPYELNSQRPLSELMANIPEMQGRWELTRGGKARAEILWQPVLELWRLYLKQIVR